MFKAGGIDGSFGGSFDLLGGPALRKDEVLSDGESPFSVKSRQNQTIILRVERVIIMGGRDLIVWASNSSERIRQKQTMLLRSLEGGWGRRIVWGEL